MAVMTASSRIKASKVGRSKNTVTASHPSTITGPLDDFDSRSSKVAARRSQRVTKKGIKRPLSSPPSPSGSTDTLEEGNKLALLQNLACLPGSSSVLLHEGAGMKGELKPAPGKAVTVGDGSDGSEYLTPQSLSSSSSDVENEVLEEEDEDYPKTITVQLSRCKLPYRWAEPPPKFKSCLSGQPLRSYDLGFPGGVLRGAINGDILGEVGDDFCCYSTLQTSVYGCCVSLPQSFCYGSYPPLGILAFFVYGRPGPFLFCEELP